MYSLTVYGMALQHHGLLDVHRCGTMFVLVCVTGSLPLAMIAAGLGELQQH